MQAGAQYDIAHAKALGWSQLRAKQAKKEREAAERRRIARGARRAKRAEKAHRAEKAKIADGSEDDQSSDDTDTDFGDEDWSAICAIGLKVFSHDPKLELEVKLSPELTRLLDEASNTNAIT